jgi:hypothetical protein
MACALLAESGLSFLRRSERSESEQRRFKIRAADSHGHRSSASILIERRYAWRGYRNASLPMETSANRITLNATEHDETIGTITIGLDGAEGLAVEGVFPDWVAQLRASGHRICEFTKLAMDPTVGSKRVIASLFHVAYILAHRIRGYDTLLIEVNPRHVAFYRRMLGCKVMGEARQNPRVDAPAVLLYLDLNHTREQIAKFGGQAELAIGERSLYPYAFSMEEERGIVRRLERAAGEAQVRPAMRSPAYMEPELATC